MPDHDTNPSMILNILSE